MGSLSEEATPKQRPERGEQGTDRVPRRGAEDRVREVGWAGRAHRTYRHHRKPGLHTEWRERSATRVCSEERHQGVRGRPKGQIRDHCGFCSSVAAEKKGRGRQIWGASGGRGLTDGLGRRVEDVKDQGHFLGWGSEQVAGERSEC